MRRLLLPAILLLIGSMSLLAGCSETEKPGKAQAELSGAPATAPAKPGDETGKAKPTAAVEPQVNSDYKGPGIGTKAK